VIIKLSSIIISWEKTKHGKSRIVFRKRSVKYFEITRAIREIDIQACIRAISCLRRYRPLKWEKIRRFKRWRRILINSRRTRSHASVAFLVWYLRIEYCSWYDTYVVHLTDSVNFRPISVYMCKNTLQNSKKKKRLSHMRTLL